MGFTVAQIWWWLGVLRQRHGVRQALRRAPGQIMVVRRLLQALAAPPPQTPVQTTSPTEPREPVPRAVWIGLGLAMLWATAALSFLWWLNEVTHLP